ncbi:hypothetical protein D9613_008843 [Agrocybe pediades]|uniref:Uncharacterized protein n=1 Tax=Agrocybe pediades TaxID=84607 RepID=A0A8H4VNP9_9AGAR|nr:hypothetical protein D9613_008843 [Agrocybe pediades]
MNGQVLQDSTLRSNLPPELHELIINELDGEEDALKQCALTCRLYSPAEKLLVILAQSPHIANYVRCLSLRGIANTRWFTGLEAPVDNGVVDVLRSLIKVRDLRLCGFSWQSKAYLPPLSLASMAMIQFKCQSIPHLTLENMEELPLTILSGSSSVESLAVDQVRFIHDRNKQRGLQSIAFNQISFLHLKRMLGGIEALSVNMDNDWFPIPAADFQAVTGNIQNSTKSLKTLDITVSTNLPVLLHNDEAIFNVSTMPLLEEISLTGAIINSETEENNNPINLHWLFKHLETIPTGGRKFNKVSLHSIITGAPLVIEEKFDDEGLKYFEDLVLNVVLPQALSLSVKFTVHGLYGNQKAETLIKQHLPSLHAKNLLEFDTEVDESLDPDRD